MDDRQIEAVIQARNLTAPRVTPESIESRIKAEYYFTAAQGARMEFLDKAGSAETSAEAEKAFAGFTSEPSMHLLTICVLVMQNGFTVLGTSACASPSNFDADLAKQIARLKAIDQLWSLEGYLLRERLSAA
jgi:hypothetical protein